MLRRGSYTGIIAIISLLWAGCTTQKNTFLTRSFHNTTAHFNGYFWGNLSYEEGLQKLNDNHKEDYTSILPIFVYADDKEAQTIYPEMDRAIKKATTMIEKHTITNKQKREIPDAVKYIKYCYLLLAKARIYKNEYLTGIEALDYAAKEYRKTGVKFEAIMWEARAYNQIGAVSKSEELIDLLKSSLQTPKNLNAGVYATTADYYMRTGQYNDVAKWLKKAVEAEKKKPVRARYYFILAQLAQQAGDKHMAFDLYTKVLHNHPPYDLEFEANINRAVLFMGDDKENQNIKNLLFKMLKPTRNIDNRDQIYYALAQISEKEGDTNRAIKYLKQSVRSSTTNTRQKAISFLAIADINFQRTEYITAKKYYDSTLLSLPKNYLGRDSIVQKKQNLERLVKCLNMIALEDSVLRLSKMDPKELDKYLDKVIENQKNVEAQKKKQDALAAENQNNTGGGSTPPGLNAPALNNGSWYFYNPSQIQMGTNEFNQKWGNRVLEDNWRRSKKMIESSQGSSGNETAKAGDDTIKVKTSASKKDSLKNKFSKNSYLKNIPKTEGQIKAANDSLVEAYYNAGCIYREYLRNNNKAAIDFEDLLARYPDNKYKLSVYYQLYRIYSETGNTERMNYYKNILLTKYPTTEYAQLIANPEKYRQNLKANLDEMSRLYSATLESYEASKYLEVMHNCKLADSLYPKNPLTAKFAYLEAVATGYSEGLDAYKNALTRVIILYPRDSIKFLAQSTLDYLNRKHAAQATTDTTVRYSLDPDSVFYWIAIIDNKEVDKINGLRNTLSNTNSQTYSQDHLGIDNILINPGQQMILIRQFKTQESAKNYYGFLNNDAGLFKQFSPNSYHTFYISAKNFHIMFNHRKADEYEQFFKEKGL